MHPSTTILGERFVSALILLVTAFSLTACGGGSSGAPTSQALQQQPSVPLPAIVFTANPASIDAGQSTTLTWSATHAASCNASGDWAGIKGISGSFKTAPLNQSASFSLSCNGDGGGAVARVTVTVASNIPSNVALSANPPGVPPKGSTTLTWKSTNVSSCVAGGGWNGNKTINGSQSVGPLDTDTTYELNCDGPQGKVVAITTVTLRVATLAWDAPTRNTDGSTLTDLTGYTLYWGPDSRQYNRSLAINNPVTTRRTIDLAPGTYYFAITAVNQAGVESGYSNELNKSIF